MTTVYIVCREKNDEKHYLSGNGCAIGSWSPHRKDAFRFRHKKFAQRRARQWKGIVEVIDNG